MTADLAKVTTPSGYSLPPFPRHALTTHLPTWEALLGFVDRKPEVMSRIKSMYPRMMLHRDVVELASHIARFAKVGDDQTCVPYPSLEAAEHQIAFCTDPRRGEAMLNTENLNLRAFDIDIRYYAVFFAAENADKVMPFWTNAGVGASSRMAEQSMQHIDQMKEVALPEPSPAAYLEDHQIETPATLKVKERIASLMERAPVGGPRDDNIKVKPDDIYLYPSGMAGIWWVHEYLIGARSGTTVLYGFAFHCTPHVLEDFGSRYRVFGIGSTEELDQIESFLESEKRDGRKIQAIWAEFPANPMLTTPDLSRLRQLANRFDTILCIDDTIGAFCNVDIMGADGADIKLTSLSKTFSGYADVLGGSAVLNPLSKVYSELQRIFSKRYHYDVYPLDMEALEVNSRDYFERSKAFNSNAKVLAEFLETKARDANSCVKTVMYPAIHSQLPNYLARKRPDTPEFNTGFGCLLSLDFNTITETITFYDTLSKYIHIGPHIGAHRPLVLAYVRVIYPHELEQVAPWGLNYTAIRVSIGSQDDPKELLRIFEVAVKAADAVRGRSEEILKAPNGITTPT